ncbi:GNAT family N-acetyltransferase [Phormidium sp. CCY1219]|uniref:GNAT family N-acetyltransferase n=1 Tax=Phormidium sp. CCY1219 TaxID=2886104 RepID=UPI002D1F8DCB|nr:GNAT family N-acetyltransferase [Phormidium sp. CCY1219]MEB3828305.1 GNAT family N-acetyltransferase [Phormidium sp. CCY1219]
MSDRTFGDLPSLETPRLLLRKMTLADAVDIFEYASNPKVAQYVTWPVHQSLDDTHQFLTSVLERYAQQKTAPWAIVHKNLRQAIGTCGFVNWHSAHNRAEIGYALSAKYWGCGYMTEAVCTAIDFGFREKGLHRIEGRCKLQNIASARVLEKAGMTFEGILRQQMLKDEVYYDMKIFSILRQEWENK